MDHSYIINNQQSSRSLEDAIIEETAGGNIAFTVEGFQDYVVKAQETPLSFVLFVLIFVLIGIIAPLIYTCWSREREERKQNKVQAVVQELSTSSEEEASTAQSHRSIHTPIENNNTTGENNNSNKTEQQKSSVKKSSIVEHEPVKELSLFHREHLEAMKQIKREMSPTKTANIQPQQQIQQQQQLTRPQRTKRDSSDQTPNKANLNTIDRSSNVPSSVATTSRIYKANNNNINSSSSTNTRKRTLRSRMPWRSSGTPIPRAVCVQRLVQLELQSQISSSIISDGTSYLSRRTNMTYTPRRTYNNNNGPRTSFTDRKGIINKRNRNGQISNAAGSLLDGEMVDGEAAEYYHQHHHTNHHRSNRRHKRHSGKNRHRRRHQNNIRRRPSSNHSLSRYGADSENASIMPPLHPDVLSPEDAADAHDPGRTMNPIQYHAAGSTAQSSSQISSTLLGQSNAFSVQFSKILDLAEPDFEMRRMLSMAIPSTISALADPVFRIVLVAIISHFIDTDSMVAYILVTLFIKLTTEEISGAISDAESNLIEDALMQNNDIAFYQAGRIVQLAIFVQLIIGIPVLLMWYLLMENVVNGLVADETIATIASSYTGVIIIDYILRGVTRTFILPFYLTGQAQFESNIDLLATIITLITIAIVATTNDLTLPALGWIQVIIGIAKTIIKISYIIIKGWLIPFKKGLLNGLVIKDTAAVAGFLMQALPLFLGSLLELGEWEILVFFVSHLGGAEVVAWAMMGVIWEIFVALTEGLGEAASVRVSFYLTEGLPDESRKLANKVVFITFVLVMGVTSIFLLVGPNVSVALTKDIALQHLFSELIGFACIADVSMTFAQMYWSLAGAQGRFSIASASILFCRWIIIVPIACICIFGYSFDLVSVAGSVAVGYTVAAFALALCVFRSDWQKLAILLRDDVPAEDNQYYDEVPDGSDDESDEEEDSSESSSYHSYSDDEEEDIEEEKESECSDRESSQESENLLL